MSAIARLRWARRIDPPQNPGRRAVMRAVLTELVDCANPDGEAWPSLAYLADATGYDQRWVQRAVQWLEMDDFIHRKAEPGRVNMYRVNFPVPLPKLGWTRGAQTAGTPGAQTVRGDGAQAVTPTAHRPWGGRRTGRDPHGAQAVTNENSELNSELNSEENSEGGTTRYAPPEHSSPNCPRHPQGTDLACAGCATAREEYTQWRRRHLCVRDGCTNPIDQAEPQYRLCTRHIALRAAGQ